jgi:NitT/TauT family transport system ATP-binding protein
MDADPGTVQATLSVEIDRPRERTAHEFVEYVAQIRDELGEPVDTSS